MSSTRLPDDLSELDVENRLFLGLNQQLINQLINDKLFINFLNYTKERYKNKLEVARDLLYTSCYHLVRELGPTQLTASNIMRIILVAALTREVNSRGGQIEQDFGSTIFWRNNVPTNKITTEEDLNELLEDQWERIKTEMQVKNIQIPTITNIPNELPTNDVDVRTMLENINKTVNKSKNLPREEILSRPQQVNAAELKKTNSTARIRLDIPLREEKMDRIPPSPSFADVQQIKPIKILDIKQVNVIDYGGYDLVKRNENENELKTMGEGLKKRTIEFQCKNKGLEYRVLGPDNVVKTRLVPWKDLPKFPKDEDQILKRKDELLPILVRETMKVGDTLTSYKSLLDITITRDGNKEVLKNIDMGPQTTIMTQAINPDFPNQKKPVYYFDETKNNIFLPGIDGYLHKIDLNKKNVSPERVGVQHTTDYVRKDGTVHTHGSYVTSVGLLKSAGQEKTITSSAEHVYIWDKDMKSPDKIHVPGSRVIRSVVGLDDGHIACTDRTGQLYIITPNKQIYKCGEPKQVIKEKFDRRGRKILQEDGKPQVEKEFLNNLSVNNDWLHQSNGLKEGIDINVRSLLESIKNNEISPMKIEKPNTAERNRSQSVNPKH